MLYQPEHVGTSEYFVYYTERNLCYPHHMHRSYEIIFVSEGEMTVTVENTSYALTAGECVLVFPYQAHSIFSRSSRARFCIFSPDMVKDFVRQHPEQVPLSNLLLMDQNICQLFRSLDKQKTYLFKKGALCIILDFFNQSASYKKSDKDPKSILPQIFSFVDKCMLENCSLEALSAHLGYNYSYLSRYFKNAVGISFTEYVTSCRLNRACDILKNEKISIVDCALECGFVSLRNFNRTFKERYGVSPTQYRNEYQNARGKK